MVRGLLKNILNAQRSFHLSVCMMILPHMAWLQRKNLVMMVRRFKDYRPGQKTLMAKRAGGPQILNIPKILGGVVEATTNGEPLVESSISVDIEIGRAHV